MYNDNKPSKEKGGGKWGVTREKTRLKVTHIGKLCGLCKVSSAAELFWVSG